MTTHQNMKNKWQKWIISKVFDMKLSLFSYTELSFFSSIINVREYRRGNQKRTIQRNWQQKEHKTKQNKQKNTTQYVLDNNICKQTYITQIRHEPSFKQLEIKTDRTSCLCGIPYYITIACSIFDSNNLMTYLFWSSKININFFWCSWLIDIKSVRSISFVS